MNSKHSELVLTFKPAASRGGVNSILFSLLMIGILCGVFIPANVLTGDLTLAVTSILLVSGNGVLFGTMIYGYYSMTFFVAPGQVTARWAFLKTVIPSDIIASIGRPVSGNFDGLKSGGAALPGHLYGAFRLLLDGTFKPIKLVATNLANLVIITTSAGKYYGLTPTSPGDFIARVKQYNNQVVERVFDNASPLALPATTTSKYHQATRGMLIAGLALAGGTLVLFLAVHARLPAIVPLHFNITGVPDRWGDKAELLWFAIIFLLVATAFNFLLYLAVSRKSELQNSKFGPAIMLLPLAISVVFSVLLLGIAVPLMS